MATTKYHVALSFAGEDREYVDRVARYLKKRDVLVFYDKFDEINLWGKDLYTYLNDIYQNKAYYTVIFISQHYKKKLWANHERRSAQARAFGENREYILPARFDDTEIPGVLKTTGYIKLEHLSAKEFAEMIVKKLDDAGVFLKPDPLFDFSESALSDIDFDLSGDDPVIEIIRKLKKYNWHIQNPAIDKLSEVDLKSMTNDQAFVLGRNIYQCACGNVHHAVDFIEDLRRRLSIFPAYRGQCVLAGMFYEVYFNSKGGFRKFKLKGNYIDRLFELQTVKKYKRCIDFIRKELEPYKEFLAVLPNDPPMIINLKLYAKETNPLKLTKLIYKNSNLLVPSDALDEELADKMWRLSHGKFSLETLHKTFAEACVIPISQIEISTRMDVDDSVMFVLPKGMTICCAFGCLGKK